MCCRWIRWGHEYHEQLDLQPVQGVRRPWCDEQLVSDTVVGSLVSVHLQLCRRHRVLFARPDTGEHSWKLTIVPLDDRDRTAYISDVKYGTPSYEAQMNSVDHNFIIANCKQLTSSCICIAHCRSSMNMSMCDLNYLFIMKLSDLVNDTQTEQARALTRMMGLAVRHNHPAVSIPRQCVYFAMMALPQGTIYMTISSSLRTRGRWIT